MMMGLIASALLSTADLVPVGPEGTNDGVSAAIVTGGIVRMPIVAEAGDERACWAARYLAGCIRTATGVAPGVYLEVSGRPVTNSPALRVGKVAASSDLEVPADDPEAFRVVTRGGSVHFLGRADYAVFDWCERHLGVRTYPDAPGLDGMSVPRVSELVVPPTSYDDRPVFAHRVCCLGARGLWPRIAKAGGSHVGGVNVHSPTKWFEDRNARDDHPAIFALKPDGTRGEMPLLCYGNPETLEYYMRRIERHIADIEDSGGIVDTERKVITVSQWDCRVECGCADCRLLYDAEYGMNGSASGILWGHFLKPLAAWVKERYQDYTVSFLPYMNTCRVPPGLDLTAEGNCEAMLCTMPGLAMFRDKAVRGNEERLIRDWARVTGRKVLNWHYACWPREFTTAPYLFGRLIAEHYQRMRDCEVGSFVNGGPGGATEQLDNYVWLRCLWNPDVDVGAIYDGFAIRMFGRAALPMRRLMRLQERGWLREWPSTVCRMDNIFGISYPPDEVEEMKRLLCEAAELAKGDEAAAARVRWYAADFAPFFADAKRWRDGWSPRPFRIVRSESQPTLDGRLDEECWRQIPDREFVTASGGAKPRRRTRAKALWTDYGVVFGFHGEEPEQGKLNLAEAYGEIKKQDTVEIFIDASGDTTGTCYRIMADLRGRVTTTTTDREWDSSGVWAAVSFVKGGWEMEVLVPFFAVPKAEAWHGNLARWHAGDSEERETSRLVTREGRWNQDRDAFTAMPFSEDR